MRKLFVFTILFISAFSGTVCGQLLNKGKLNVWTTGTISRQNFYRNAPPVLKEVRVAKNKGFDRVVFEFTGEMPDFQIEYTKPPIMGTGEDVIKVVGKYFVEINLQMLVFPEDENFKYKPIEQANLKLPVVSEVQEIEWFEGVRPFAIGLKSKKGFRIQQLKNPTRLVIDFKQ
jgi:hypothetical protein